MSDATYYDFVLWERELATAETHVFTGPELQQLYDWQEEESA